VVGRVGEGSPSLFTIATMMRTHPNGATKMNIEESSKFETLTEAFYYAQANGYAYVEWWDADDNVIRYEVG